MKLQVNDRVSVDSDGNKYPKIKVYVEVENLLTESGEVEPGASGVVMRTSSSVPGEDRFVWVKFTDGKVAYVSERYLKKA